MKKLYLWTLAILFPVMLYIVLFFSNDPYDYFGRDNIEGDDTALIGKMLELRNGEYDGIIIGDSRVASYNVEKLNRMTGLRFMNLSYGGSMTEEMTTLFWYCIQNCKIPPKKVIFVNSFYNMNTLLQKDRVTTTEQVIESPIKYAFSIENAEAMLCKIRDRNKDKKNGVASAYREEPSAVEKRKNFSVSRESMAYYLKGYSYSWDVIDTYCEVLDYCTDNNIDVCVVLPPCYEEFYDLLNSYGLLKNMDQYKRTISMHAVVYDFEYKDNRLSSCYDDFSDYLHFHGNTFDKFIKVIEEDDFTLCKIWMNGVVENG